MTAAASRLSEGVLGSLGKMVQFFRPAGPQPPPTIVGFLAAAYQSLSCLNEQMLPDVKQRCQSVHEGGAAESERSVEGLGRDGGFPQYCDATATAAPLLLLLLLNPHVYVRQCVVALGRSLMEVKATPFIIAAAVRWLSPLVVVRRLTETQTEAAPACGL